MFYNLHLRLTKVGGVFPRAGHRVRLARSRLAVREQSPVAPAEQVLHHRLSHGVVHVLLRAVLVEDVREPVLIRVRGGRVGDDVVCGGPELAERIDVLAVPDV